jgi:hypothetical protein
VQRTVSFRLDAWLADPGRKPLVLRGVRQVGKTWLVRDLAERSGRSLVEVNFERAPALKSHFASNDPQHILGELSLAMGKLLCDGWSRNPRLLPASRMAECEQPPNSLPRVAAHDRAWLDAATGGPRAISIFEHGGLQTELVLLGNVAIRTGEMIHWGGPAMRATNRPEAEKYVRASYRAGWTL